jgi:hypothetical protein
MLSIFPVDRPIDPAIPVGFSVVVFFKDGERPRPALASVDGSEIYCLLPWGADYIGQQSVTKIYEDPYDLSSDSRSKLIPGAMNLKISFTDAAGDEVVISAQGKAP